MKRADLLSMADKKDDKKSSLKKTLEKEDADLSSDSEGSQLDINCETCGINFSDVKNYENHMNGKKHRKAVAEKKALAKYGEFNKEIEDESESDDDDDSKEIYCKVCDKYLTGYIPYMTHLKGSKHAKNVKKEKLKERMKNMPEVVDNVNKDNTDDDDDDTLENIFARCEMCQKEFGGPETFNMHLKSSLHKKKVQQSKIVESLKAKYQDESKSDNGDDAFGNCSVCQKSFSGPVPYQIHMESKLHKKNQEKMKIAEEFKEFCTNDENGTAYECKECKKTFTDPAAFKNHKKKNSHEKQKAKKALFDFLTSNPEIVFTTPFGDQNDEKDKDTTDEEYFLICKVCNTAFTGPESAQDHIKSGKHITRIKEQKMKNLLKEQQKQANDSSSKSKSVEKKTLQKATGTEMSNVKNGDSANGQTNGTENLHNVDDFELI